MSWSLFKTRCSVLTGPQHVSETLFAQTIAQAYHQTVLLHFESMTAGGKVINAAPKLPLLQQQIQVWCTANMTTHSEINFLQQIGPAFVSYWTGIIIAGPTGIVTVYNPGVWNGIYLKQHLDFNIFINALILCCRTHITSLSGQYVSTVLPSVTAPWSGVMLQALP